MLFDKDGFTDYNSKEYLILNFVFTLIIMLCVVLFIAWIGAGPDETFNSFALYSLGGLGLIFLICGYKW